MTTFLTFILLFSLDSNPPGTIKVKNYYVDKTEILNLHWWEYVHYKKEELDSLELSAILPDSSNFWYRTMEYRFKPVVLITYEQAVNYCTWRSKIVSEKLGIKITYRLPTSTEWKEIAEELLKNESKRIEKDLLEARRIIGKDSVKYLLFDREKIKNRIYDIFDNVTEMTLEKGVAMGVNNDELVDLKTNLIREYKYNTSNAYLGFRCIAEIED
jgi:formylglycine-generating enzyme required for sulfatase activity